MNRSVFSVQGLNCYVDYRFSSGGKVNYLVGTISSPESPVSVSLKGTDSPELRFTALQEGLVAILDDGSYY